MTDKELMQQTLYTLEHFYENGYDREDCFAAITNLLQRLAQPEQEPVAWVECNGELVWNNRKAAIGRNLYTIPPQPEQSRAEKMRDAGYTRRPTLREIAREDEQPEQEPVAWWLPKHPHPDMVSRVKWSDECEPLYTTPPRCPNCASLEAQNTELDAKLAEMEKGEPVAWRDHVEQRLLTWRQSFVNRSGDQLALDDFMDKESLDDLIDYVCDEYTTPPRREWQGLTDEEIKMLPQWYPSHETAAALPLIRAVEAKLKQRNT